jgi:hypothetical protein
MIAKRDFDKHQERHENWKKNPTIKNLSRTNEKLLINFLLDMEIGVNVGRSSKKGARSFPRLNNYLLRFSRK